MRRHLWWLLGLVLVGGGLAIVLTSQTRPTDFGWFAYSPTQDGGPDWYMAWGDDRSAVILSRAHLLGATVAGLGLLVLTAGAGYRLGRRTRP